MKPVISVIIPAYNEAKALPACLKSLQSQLQAPPFEIIVVDNNSSDTTGDIARKHGVIVVDQSVRGVCAARQAGLEIARGEIIVSSDADCTYPANWLHEINQAFASQPDLQLLLGNYRFTDAPPWANILLKWYEWLCLQVFYAFNRTMYASAANLAFRRSSFDAYDTKLTQGGDELYVLQHCKQSGRVHYRFTNPVLTCGRRMQQGFIKTFFHDFMRSYLLNYIVTRRTGRNLAGSYVPLRSNLEARSSPNFAMGVFIATALVISLVLLLVSIQALMLVSRIEYSPLLSSGLLALSMGLLAYAVFSPHSQLAGPQPFRVRTKRRVVALTFDDGPNGQFSLDIASYIESYGGHATFFSVGHNVAKQPDITRQLYERGHLIGNHSYNHTFGDYFKRGWIANIIKTNGVIAEACGEAPRFVRLPWLFRTPWLLTPLYKLGLQPVAGTFMHLKEFRQPDGVAMARKFAAKVRPGEIIIMHDGYNAQGGDRRQTVRAVAELCKQLAADGYQFVRVDALL